VFRIHEAALPEDAFALAARAVRLTLHGDSVPIRAVKFSVPLLALAALSLAACSTLVNRRDAYRPTKADGPWTRSLQDGSYKERKVADAQFPGERKAPAAPPKPAETKPQ